MTEQPIEAKPTPTRAIQAVSSWLVDWEIVVPRVGHEGTAAALSNLERRFKAAFREDQAIAADLLAALSNLVLWLEASDMHRTPAGGVGPYRRQGTEYQQVTAARAAIRRAKGDDGV
jgi:hypothetical protein